MARDLNQEPTSEVDLLSGTGSWAQAGNVEDAVMGADAVLILTEWQHYRDLNWQALAARMRKPGSLMQGLSPILPRSKPLASAYGALATERVDGTHCLGDRSCWFHRSCLESAPASARRQSCWPRQPERLHDPALKQARLRQIEAVALEGAWRFVEMSLEDSDALMGLFAAEKPTVVVNLAAQAGVRYSLENPAAYIQSNLVGFGHLLEGCRHHGIENLVYASSSSVYGGNRNLPFHEQQPVNHPVSLYAASKKANELMAHTYSHLYGLPATGLRFSRYMAPGAALTWLRCSSHGPSLRMNRSRFSTTAKCSGTSLTSTTSSRV